jgi:hypothetical protein
MTPYKRFANPKYVKVFNYFLKTIVEKQFERKYHQDIKLNLYGIKIKPNSSKYNSIPVEELLNSQATVIFFIDSENPKLNSSNFIEDLIYKSGKTFLMLQDSTWFSEPNKFQIKFVFNKRPLYDLDYKSDDSLNENSKLNEGQYDYEDSEEYYQKIDNLLNNFLKTFKEKDMPNFLGYKVISGKDRYRDFTIKLTGIFKKPFSVENSDAIHSKSRTMIKLIKKIFPFLQKATFYGGGTSTLDNYEKNLDWEKHYFNREVKDDKDNNLPFIQEEKNGIKRRLFKEGIDNHELKWHFDELDRNVKVVKSNGWLLQMDNEIPKQLKEGENVFIPKGKYHRIIKGFGDLIVEVEELNGDIILERTKSELRSPIRNIVKDITKIFKENDEGIFYLPEDLGDGEEMHYEFAKLPIPITVEVEIEPNDDVNDYTIDGEYWRNEDTITIRINYNPEKKEKITYNLIGELNEIVAHELRHIYQKLNDLYDLDKPEEGDSFKYYTQPDEIDAQIFGFKRISKLTKKPFDVVVKDWFATHKDIHNLNDNEMKEVISIILKNK